MENDEIPPWSGGFQFLKGVWVHASCYRGSRFIYICCLIHKRYALHPVLSESNVYLSRNVAINIRMHPAFVVITVEDDGASEPTARKRVTVMDCWLEFGANSTKSYMMSPNNASYYPSQVLHSSYMQQTCLYVATNEAPKKLFFWSA